MQETYIALSEQQLLSFKKSDNTFREDITAEEIDPLLFGTAKDGKRPSFLVREDPLASLEHTNLTLSFQDPADRETINSRESDGDTTEPGSGADSPGTIPDFVNRLIRTMNAPEIALATGNVHANQEVIEKNIASFSLKPGPADVPSFYDFHSLQIAFDFVWQKAIDEGIIESGKALAHQLEEMGGDPLAALTSNAAPIKGLREELRLIQRAHNGAGMNQLLTPGMLQVPEEDGGGNSIPPTPGNPNGLANPPSRSDTLDPGNRSPHELLGQIDELLNERFAFEVFAPGSINFGVLVTYRQRWEHINDQVGRLVKTITLTPKETRKISVKRVIKKDRSVKEMEDSLRIRKEQSKSTSRAEAEIVAKAEAKTNFSLTAQGSYNLLISKGDATTVFGKDAANSSSDTKKAFREAVFDSSQEYRDEHKTEVETKESFEEEVSETTELRNDNAEIPVTYYLYELQRCFEISECIHRLAPVVLVAMNVPGPSRKEINALLLKYGWIIDRVLLDDQFRLPLEYFRTKLVGDEVALQSMLANLMIMRGVVEELKKSYTQARDRSAIFGQELINQIVVKAQATDAQQSESIVDRVVEAFKGDDDTISIEAARILEDAARERYDAAINQERELRTQLDSETAALKVANDAYSKALADHLNRLTDIGSLRLHIKENILYYMQAIWSHTFRDQLYLSLLKWKVPKLTLQQVNYRMSDPDTVPASITPKPGQTVVEVSANLELQSNLNSDRDFADLVEVADLDNLLGFKGNYLIFPLRESNVLTDFMMTPFVDAELGLRDPDEAGNWTPKEFVSYAKTLHAQMREQVKAGSITQEELDATIDQLSVQFRRLLSAPRRAVDQVIVPTDSLYIEATAGTHPVIEHFQLQHRAADVMKVLAEDRKLELENLRYAARILEGEREDPDTEKKVIIDNGDKVIVEPN